MTVFSYDDVICNGQYCDRQKERNSETVGKSVYKESKKDGPNKCEV